MLVLSRKVGEQIVIGDNIQLTVIQIGAHSVRVGIEAPQDQRIVRKEILENTPSAKMARIGGGVAQG